MIQKKTEKDKTQQNQANNMHTKNEKFNKDMEITLKNRQYGTEEHNDCNFKMPQRASTAK